MKKVLTLCLVYQHPRVLLGMKKRGFGQGKWNGFGGKVEVGETIEQAARREVREEAGIEVGVLEKIGELDFVFKNDPQTLNVHIFKTNEYAGEPIETDEMKPQWFHVDEILFEFMWPDDRYWFPLFLSGKKFTGTFRFDGYDTIVHHELNEIYEQAR